MNILGVIPARAGSKGIKDKNIYSLCGKPLIEWTIEAVQKSKLDNYIITTDIEELILREDATARPLYLAQDDTPMLPVICHALLKAELYYNTYFDAVMILQPTSPLRTVEDINKAIDLFIRANMPNPMDTPHGASSLYSGYYMGIKTKEPYDKHKTPKHFQRNGAIFITSRQLLEQGKLWDSDAIEFVMPESRSIDIDTMEQMMMAEALLKGGVLEWKL